MFLYPCKKLLRPSLLYSNLWYGVCKAHMVHIFLLGNLVMTAWGCFNGISINNHPLPSTAAQNVPLNVVSKGQEIVWEQNQEELEVCSRIQSYTLSWTIVMYKSTQSGKTKQAGGSLNMLLYICCQMLGHHVEVPYWSWTVQTANGLIRA